MYNKSYNELIKLKTFEERVKYLMTGNKVGKETFADRRIVNQNFYRSKEWKRTREKIIIRDNGCDIGIPNMEIMGNIIVHHINPINEKDIENNSKKLYDPNNLITVSFNTHNIITYNNEDQFKKKNMFPSGERKPGDTALC